MESNSKLQLPNADISEKSIENEDDSFVIPGTFDLNELENTNDGNESEKSVLNYKTEVLIGHDCMSVLPDNNITSNENEVISWKTNSTREINNDTGIKKSLRQAERKSYVESDIESNAYSSSDEEVVLQTRICNEEGKPISNIPDDNSSHIVERTEPNNNESDNSNKFLKDNSDCSNFENEQFEKFDSPSGKEVNTIIPVKESNQNINSHALNQKDTSSLRRSFTEKLNPKNKVAAEALSFELSSLSEVGDNEFLTDICASSSKENKINKDSNLHSDRLHSEIIQRCLDISSEVHSMCDDIETSETSTLNVIVHDFFTGILDVDKFEINKKSPRNAAFSREMYETEQKGMNKKKEILNSQKTHLSIPETQESFIINTNSDDEQEHTNKSANNKALEMKQISKKDASTIKNKRLPTVHLTKSYLNNKQKNKVHADNNLKKYQSLDRTNETKIINEDQLSHGKLSYLKRDNNNKTAVKCIGEAVIDKSLHNIRKRGNFQRHKELESHIMEDDKLEDLSSSNLSKDNSFQVNEVEMHEKRNGKDNKRYINQRTSKGEIKTRNVSLNNKSHWLTDESEIMQQRKLTSKHLKNNSQFNNIQVGQHSNQVSTDIKKNIINKERIKTEDITAHYSVENANLKKRPKTWDDLEDLFSNKITHDSHTLQDCYERPTTSKKDRNTANAVNVNGIINKPTKKARIQPDVANDVSVVSHSLQNKNNTLLKNNTEISPKTVSKRNNDLALISPNSNIINKIMKNMEKCTLPYLTSSEERQRTLFKDSKANNDSNKSPIVTEYSYSIKEIQSTICYTAGKSNSEEKFRNLIQSDNTKTRLCKISHKSVLNKNYNVQKQETTFKALSMTKDGCDNKSLVEMKLNVPQQTPKQWLKKENESTTKKNNKCNTLNNILARLEVDHNTHDSQNDIFVDNKTKSSKRRNIINKNLPNLETSISKSSSLSPEQVEQGHYNLRKRKCKNYMEELDNNQSNKKKFDFYHQSGNGKSCSITNNNSTGTKQNTDWNDENTCNTDSSCEIIDIPKQKSNQLKNRKQLKDAELKKSCPKSKNSSRPLPKKVATEFYKKVTRKCQEPINSSNNSNSDTEGSIYELRDFNTRVVTNKTHTKVSSIVPWNEDDTFDKSNTDSSSDIFPKKSSNQLNKNKNRNQPKITEGKESKAGLSYPSSNKNKITEFEKPEELLPKSKCLKSLNNGRAHFDSKNGCLRKIDKSKNMIKKNNELLSKAITPYCSNKIPQIVTKTTTNNSRHLYSGKERIFHKDFSQEQTKLSSNLQINSSRSKQNLEKSRKEDDYKIYLETMFKNTSQKTSTHQNALSTIKNQKRRENTLIEGSEENDELFSLSSSDSEDCEMPTPKTGLGLLDDTLCGSNDNGEE